LKYAVNVEDTFGLVNEVEKFDYVLAVDLVPDYNQTQNYQF